MSEINLEAAYQLFETQVTLQYQNRLKLQDTIEERHGLHGTYLNIPLSDLVEMNQANFSPTDIYVDAINLMRRMLYRTQFNKENTERLNDCLATYSKIFDEKNTIDKDHPLHDWTSHAIDAYQTMILAIEHQFINEQTEIIYYR